MMARINIDDSLEMQEEFWLLLEAMNGDRDKALGQLVRFFRIAQAAFSKQIPIAESEIKGAKLDAMIASGWAVPVSGGFESKGAEKHFAWLRQRIEAGVAGGRARARAPRDERGRLLANAKRGPDEIQADAGKIQTTSRPLAPSPALAQKTNTRRARGAYDSAFEETYKQFPRKEGKSGGFKIYSKLTPEEKAQVGLAVQNYARTKATEEPRYLKHFSTFMGEWRDWLDSEAGSVSVAGNPSINTTPLNLESL